MAAITSLQNFHYHVSNFPHKSPPHYSRSFLSTLRPPSIVPETRHSSLLVSTRRSTNRAFNYRDYFNEEYSELLTNISHRHLHHHEEECYDYNYNYNDNDECDQEFATVRNMINSDGSNNDGYYSSMSCWISSKLELFGPSFFGMKPDPPPEYWPVDEETRRSMEFAAQVDRMRRGKLMSSKDTKEEEKCYYWQVAGDYSYCSVRKVFSLTVFMIRELLSYVLRIRECLYSEDLRKVIERVQVEMNDTFVWLFESVFATTPTLMVSVMLLLANFTAYSMAGTTEMVAALPRVTSSGLVSYYEEERMMMAASLEEKELWGEMLTRIMAASERRLLNFDDIDDDDEVTEARMVSKVAECLRCENLVGHLGFGESTRCFLRILNSALFLNPNPQLCDRVEEIYEQAVVVEPRDAEVRILYAEFLQLKKDLEGAEEKYQEAIEINDNYDITSKYFAFLVETGNEGVCYPLYDLGTNYQ
ncbi:unnamed protein product [Linum trigynum]|uniref:Uncharacterized protein n=1 Tax=Linum trigynum TaxID=586398 RepID=A0AAV2CWL6_9ROSI